MRRISWFLGFIAFAGISQPIMGAHSQSYEPMSVQDFVIDGPSLAKRQAHIRIMGFYVTQGSVGMLYADQQAIIMARYHSNVSTPPSVPMLADEASHKLRSALVSCDSNPGSAQMGCQIEVSGYVSHCTLTNVFGAAREGPCFIAEDGDFWHQPAPIQTEQPRQMAAPPKPPVVTNLPPDAGCLQYLSYLRSTGQSELSPDSAAATCRQVAADNASPK